MTNNELEMCFEGVMSDCLPNEMDAGFSQTLSERWEEFVNCRSRLVCEAPFLRRLLSGIDHPRVLDAAMGIGCETIVLSQWGAEVIGNEVDDGLHSVALRRAQKQDADIHTTQVDWRDLTSAFGADSFDLVLLLGNSFCMLLDEEDRHIAARNLRSVCRSGGTLVIDQRNFDKIVRERQEPHQRSIRVKGGVMYCGASMYAAPHLLANGNMRFSFRASADDSEIGYLDGYPFRGSELTDLLSGAGFDLVETLCDLRHAPDENAEFLTHLLT